MIGVDAPATRIVIVSCKMDIRVFDTWISYTRIGISYILDNWLMHIISISHLQDVLLGFTPLSSSSTLIALGLLLLSCKRSINYLSCFSKFQFNLHFTKENGVEVCSAGARLQCENSSAVLCKIEVLEDIKGLGEYV